MEEKEINIDDEEQILNECDFDYFYNLEKCSRELCMFYNDIFKQKNNFNTRQAIIDLGRVGITLNQLLKRIKELEGKILIQLNNNADNVNFMENQRRENQQLKQQLHDLPKKIVGEIKLQLFNHFKVKNIEEYEKLPLIDSLFTADTVIEILDTILEKFGGEDE